MSVSARPQEIEAELAFTPAENVAPDAERTGLLRARTFSPEEQAAPDSYDRRTCRVHDWGEDDVAPPELLRHGFEAVDPGRVPAIKWRGRAGSMPDRVFWRDL